MKYTSASVTNGICVATGGIHRGRQRRLLTILCCLHHGRSLSLHPRPPTLRECQAREEGETESDKEWRKEDSLNKAITKPSTLVYGGSQPRRVSSISGTCWMSKHDVLHSLAVWSWLSDGEKLDSHRRSNSATCASSHSRRPFRQYQGPSL